MATREMGPTASFSTCNSLANRSGESEYVNPVMFPPGRAKLAMRPSPTGSMLPASMTMGIFVVAALAACIGAGPPNHDDIDIRPDKFGCHGRQALEVSLCEPVFEY